MLTFTLGVLHVAARDMQHSGGAVTINGIVKDAHTKKKLANVSVHLQGRDIGTVTNIVAYRQHGERSCLDYVRNTIRFKCDSESYRDSRMFYDDARQNWDTDFWQDYNIIELTESLEKAVEKLRRHNIKGK